MKALAILIAITPAVARAEPLRLRGDAYMFSTSASSVGLVDLTAGGAINDWLRADAVVWMGGGISDHDADVLIIDAHARSPSGHGEATLGRFVLTVGALRPLHLDGADVRTYLPHRFVVEAFGGAPVVPSFGPRSWDWLAGARVGRRIGDWGSAGVAYLEERDHGELSTQELGFDAGGAIDKRTDASAKLAIDLISTAIAEAQLVGTRRFGAVRVDAYAIHRSPSHLLPATSLFSVLGDVPSERGGARMSWRAAPRLDLDADLGARRIGDEVGADLTARATLRLDDRGKGALGLELRREGAAPGWTGVRGTARVPIDDALTASTELELVRPDSDARGAWWPWAIGALSWKQGAWDAGVAIEASASPEHRYRVDGLARVGHTWEAP
ncbi:MAG TPA: hypothetical protein VL463_34200 [Kofleriaceae bacterium]|nr:hypothetical protein [Kofleriaceae bacterium]